MCPGCVRVAEMTSSCGNTGQMYQTDMRHVVRIPRYVVGFLDGDD